ncbi:hypothetical protein QE152_g22158 [Popillia japonica]|uniref:Uncharacterized protein n=1 Tax=Popillia japonica TaxID=7064 RepID=A0AAW1KLQ1_POPJA
MVAPLNRSGKANMTSVVHPMGQGIIKNLKHFYRSLLVENCCPSDGSRDHQKLETLLQKFVGGKYLVRRWKRSKNKAGYSTSLPNVQTSMGQRSCPEVETL